MTRCTDSSCHLVICTVLVAAHSCACYNPLPYASYRQRRRPAAIHSGRRVRRSLMGRMESDVSMRRDLLRQRLQWLIAQDTPGAATIDTQIEDLLQDILDQDLAPLPALAWIDDRDEDQRIVVTGMGLLTPLGI